jgi:putative ABC transport system permease protein
VRRHPSRIVAVLLAVMISVGYLTATLGFLATETHAVSASVTARTAGADVVISTDGDAGKLIKPLQIAEHTQGVSAAELSYQTYGRLNGRTIMELQSVPQHSRLAWAGLISGAWPRNDHQIVIGGTAAKQQHLGLGDTLTVDLGSGAKKLVVSGISDETRSLFSGQTQNGFLVPSFFSGLGDSDGIDGDVLVLGDGSMRPEQLAAELSNRIGDQVTVRTSEAYGQDQVKDLAKGADVFRNLLLIFGAVALLVGAILIVNTFLILLAQRRRQIGLLRAVGATRGQVRRSMLVEAVITGILGAVLGVGLGVGVTAVATALSGSLDSGLVVPPTVILAAGIGVLVSLLAALGPAARATRVSPLDALSPVVDAATSRRLSVLTAIPSLLVAGAGGALILVGLRTGDQPLLLCVAGSLLLATGVLIGVKLYFPAILALLGLAARPLGPIARLATSNAARNPGRVAATGATLMLATGLIVTLQVGAASVKQSTSLMFDQHYPVDVTVSGNNGLPSGIADRVAAIHGINRTALVRSTVVKISTPTGETSELRMTAGDRIDSVINPGAGTVPSNTALVDETIAQAFGLHDGDKITVRHGSERRSLVVRPSRIAADGALVVTPAVLATMAPNAPVTGVWAKADRDANVISINADLTKLVQDHPALTVSGSLTNKAAYARLLDTVLTIATALLGVAVLIALIGVGNTLGLSVIERTRESALLRALGLQRRQLRLMLGVEAVLLAVAGAAVGIAAGAFFGWIGTAALGRELDYPTVVFSMSASQTAIVALVAIVAGVLASILPGRRAAKSAPVEALADA